MNIHAKKIEGILENNDSVRNIFSTYFPTRKVWIDLEFTGINQQTDKIREMAFIVGNFERHLKIGYEPECPKCGKHPYNTTTHATYTTDILMCRCTCGVWIYGDESKIKAEIGNQLDKAQDFLGFFGDMPKMFPGQKTAKQAMRIFLKTLPEKLGGEGGTCKKCRYASDISWAGAENVYYSCGVRGSIKKANDKCNKYEGHLLKWAGYNIAHDLKWIKSQMFPEYDPIWRWFDPEPLDVLTEVRKMRNIGKLPIKDCRLETVAAYFDIPHTPHNALSDIRATRYVWKRLETIKGF